MPDVPPPRAAQLFMWTDGLRPHTPIHLRKANFARSSQTGCYTMTTRASATVEGRCSSLRECELPVWAVARSRDPRARGLYGFASSAPALSRVYKLKNVRCLDCAQRVVYVCARQRPLNKSRTARPCAERAELGGDPAPWASYRGSSSSTDAERGVIRSGRTERHAGRQREKWPRSAGLPWAATR
eukprot:scaffold19054_cov65-Phaeocystis_antarctica.AAC.8